jgi:hypothetical protein
VTTTNEGRNEDGQQSEFVLYRFIGTLGVEGVDRGILY